MFFGKLINILKKESPGKILPRAIVVEIYETKESRIKYYGIKVGDKFGCDRNGNPISSSNYKLIRSIVWKYNSRIE